MIKDEKIAMIVGASSAYSYKKKNPYAENERIMRHVMMDIKAGRDVKIVGIAAANFVINYLNRNPKATEKEVMQNLANETGKILSSIKDQIG